MSEIGAKVEDGRVSLRIAGLLRGMSADELAEVADCIGCMDQVIKNVFDQVFLGSTDLCSWGASDECAASPTSPLGVFKRRVADESSGVAEDVLGAMSHALERKADESRRVSEWAYGLYHLMVDRGMNPPVFPHQRFADRPKLRVVDDDGNDVTIKEPTK